MKNAKVTISKNFGKSNPLNPRKRNELLMKNFFALSTDDLASARARKDIAKLVGYSEQDASGAGASFVWRLIKKGYLKETFTGFGVDGVPENMYVRLKGDKKAVTNVPTAQEKKNISVVKQGNLLQVSLQVGKGSMEIKNITIDELIQLIKSL